MGFPDVGGEPELAGCVLVMLQFALVREFLYALGGLAFVSLVLAVFVVVARFLARRILGDDDGSSLM